MLSMLITLLSYSISEGFKLYFVMDVDMSVHSNVINHVSQILRLVFVGVCHSQFGTVLFKTNGPAIVV